MGWVHALTVVGFTIVFVYKSISSDILGIILEFCLLAFFSYKSYSCFQALKVAREEDIAYGPPTDATDEEKKAYFKRTLILSAIAFPILSIIICHDLNSLEAGEVESVRVWAPVAFLYNNAGYWVAILAVPALGIFTLDSLFKKMSQ